MSGEHHFTKAIQMSLQTAELQAFGVDHKEELNLSFSLMSIARGNCNIRVKPVSAPRIGSIGWLQISIDRPVMNGEIYINGDNFENIITYFRGSYPRPVTLVIILDQELKISSVGDLMISEEKNLQIVDISWIMPLN